MNISPNEAEEALADIQKVSQKTRRSIAGSGASISLIITGVVWLVGFTCTQFLSGPLLVWIWVVTSVVGSALATFMGMRASRRVRVQSTGGMGRRILVFWLLLILFSAAGIAVARPTDGRQITVLIILFAMIGQMGMGLLLSFSATWWTVPVVAVVLAGYFLVPAWFYLWMALRGGGVMLALGAYIRLRW